MEYCMARALLDREIRMVQFSEEKLLDSKAQELLQRVRYVHPEGPEGERLPSEVVTVTLRDGGQHSNEVFIPRGAPENPLTEEELITKYKDCASLVLPPEVIERSLELVSHLEEIADISELVDLATSKGSPPSAH